MLFNSFEFLLFFPVVCIIYYFLGKNKFRNPFLLAASYFFYMNWKPAYAALILTSTILTYFCGLLVERNAGKRTIQKAYLTISPVLNLGILFFFKYFNFINESVSNVLSACGLGWNVPNLDILLPVGISFYTFQAVGYSIDVYRGTIRPERNFITYALFVSFFPQLVAGPIERAGNLLPQFHTEHRFNCTNIVEGFKLMIWGFFMKLCVADILSQYVDAVYNNVPNHNGSSLLLGTVFFAFQIYCDFAGYSTIAAGAARIMGYNLMENFRRPYFSSSIREFWKRWHVSLSSWFMDYLYIPLGGSRVKFGRHIFNLSVTFVISGLWHGADWTFVAWGALHGIYIVFGIISGRFFGRQEKKNSIPGAIRTVLCFCAVTFAWIFFRANSIQDALMIIDKIFTRPGTLYTDKSVFAYGIFSLMILIVKDIADNYKINLSFLHSRHKAVRYGSVVFLISCILLFGALDSGQFIYFQF